MTSKRTNVKLQAIFTGIRLRMQGRKSRTVQSVSVAVILLASSGGVSLGQFSVLHSFTGGADGANPYYGAPVIAGSTLYATTGAGGSNNNGVVFSVQTDGTGYTVLHSFTGVAPDGAKPYGSVVLSASNLYGTTYSGGASANGAIFTVNTDGSSYTTLYSFATSAGYKPYSTVILSGSNLYGTTYYSSGGLGAVYTVNTNGGGYTNLHNFIGGTNDGSRPLGAALTLSGSTLYGTTVHGGPGYTNTAMDGVAFCVGTDGSGYTNLVNLTGSSMGANPYGSLTLAGSRLYGTTLIGGGSNLGTIFSVNTDGSGYATLHNFTGGTNDGAKPYSTLTLDGSVLYGTTRYGGPSNSGTVFKINLDGSEFRILHSFSGADGAEPAGDVTLANNTLYGYTISGGVSNKGTVFAVAVGVPGYALEGQGFTNTLSGSVSNGGLFWSSVPTWLNIQPSLPYTNDTAFVLPSCDRVAASRLVMTAWGGTANYTCRMTVSVNGTNLPYANPFVFGTTAHSNSAYNAYAPRAYGSGYGVWLVTVPIPAGLLRTDGGTNTIRVIETTPDSFDGRLHHVTLVAVYQSSTLANVFDYAMAEGEALVYGTPVAPQVDQCIASLGPVGTNDVFAASLTALYTYGTTGQNDELFLNGTKLGGSDVAQWDTSVMNYGPSVVSFDMLGNLLTTNAVKFDVSAADVPGTRETSLRPEFVVLGAKREAPLECRNVAISEGNVLAFQWPGYATRTYTIEYSTDLLNPSGWAALTGYASVTGTNGLMNCQDAVDGTVKFYRVIRH